MESLGEGQWHASSAMQSWLRAGPLENTLVVSIVDDDESMRVATSSLVRSLGWDVHLYASAEAFLQSGRVADVCCVMSDIQMPGMTGLELQRHLVDNGYTLPIIFITAFPSEPVRKQAMRNRAMCFLGKPVDGNAVSLCLDRIRAGASSSGGMK